MDEARRHQIILRLEFVVFGVLTVLLTIFWHYWLGGALGQDGRASGWVVGGLICLTLGAFATAPASSEIAESIESRMQRRAWARERQREADRLGGWET